MGGVFDDLYFVDMVDVDLLDIGWVVVVGWYVNFVWGEWELVDCWCCIEIEVDVLVWIVDLVN